MTVTETHPATSHSSNRPRVRHTASTGAGNRPRMRKKTHQLFSPLNPSTVSSRGLTSQHLTRGANSPSGQPLPPSLRPSPLPVPLPVTLPSSKANALQSVLPSAVGMPSQKARSDPALVPATPLRMFSRRSPRQGVHAQTPLRGHAPPRDTLALGLGVSLPHRPLRSHPRGFCFLFHTLTMEATACA